MSIKSIMLTTVATFAATSAMADGHLTEVSFGTNWVAQAEHGGYYQAVADGTYEECGLKVTIVPGGPQVNNRAMMIAGRIDFLMGGNMLQPYFARSEGIPVKVVAAHFQKEPQVLMTHPGKVSSFEGLKDLEQLIIGDNGFTSFYQWMISDYGFSAENRIPYTFNPAPFLANENSAQQGYITSEPFAIEREGGFVPDLYLLADFGFSTYSTTVETMEDTIAEMPDAVTCFVEASSIGWANFLYGDNASAVELIKADNPDMSDEQIAFSVNKLKEFGIVDSGASLELGIGAMTDEQNADFFNKMISAGVIDGELDFKDTYTLDFANTGAALETKNALVSN
jgi:NitT/TauT family transport system substrate-binding protein